MNALSMPLDNLNSNWMYLVTARLAWTLKSWTALSLAVDGCKRAEKRRRDRLLNMEFATLLQAMITLPAQVIRSGRQTIVRFLNVNDWTASFFDWSNNSDLQDIFNVNENYFEKPDPGCSGPFQRQTKE